MSLPVHGRGVGVYTEICITKSTTDATAATDIVRHSECREVESKNFIWKQKLLLQQTRVCRITSVVIENSRGIGLHAMSSNGPPY